MHYLYLHTMVDNNEQNSKGGTSWGNQSFTAQLAWPSRYMAIVYISIVPVQFQYSMYSESADNKLSSN